MGRTIRAAGYCPRNSAVEPPRSIAGNPSLRWSQLRVRIDVETHDDAVVAMSSTKGLSSSV